MKKYYLLATTALVASFMAGRAAAESVTADLTAFASIYRTCTATVTNSSVSFPSNMTLKSSDFNDRDYVTITLSPYSRSTTLSNGYDVSRSDFDHAYVGVVAVDCAGGSISSSCGSSGSYCTNSFASFIPIIGKYGDSSDQLLDGEVAVNYVCSSGACELEVGGELKIDKGQFEYSAQQYNNISIPFTLTFNY